MTQYTNDLLEKIRLQLEEEKKRVAGRVNELQAQDPFNDPDRLNDNAASDSEASEEANHDRVAALITELHVQLVAIDAALSRIGNGSYGTCAACGAHIGEDRLSFLPTATLCLSCEQKKSTS